MSTIVSGRFSNLGAEANTGMRPSASVFQPEDVNSQDTVKVP